MTNRHTLFHTLKNCVSGWSHLEHFKLDVRKVVNVEVKSRLFCILDRDYPLTLGIWYHAQTSELRPIPVFTMKGIGFGVSESYIEKAWITKRYKNMDDINADLSEINRLKAILNAYDKKQQSQFDEFVKELTVNGMTKKELTETENTQIDKKQPNDDSIQVPIGC